MNFSDSIVEYVQENRPRKIAFFQPENKVVLSY